MLGISVCYTDDDDDDNNNKKLHLNLFYQTKPAGRSRYFHLLGQLHDQIQLVFGLPERVAVGDLLPQLADLLRHYDLPLGAVAAPPDGAEQLEAVAPFRPLHISALHNLVTKFTRRRYRGRSGAFVLNIAAVLRIRRRRRLQ